MVNEKLWIGMKNFLFYILLNPGPPLIRNALNSAAGNAILASDMKIKVIHRRLQQRLVDHEGGPVAAYILYRIPNLNRQTHSTRPCTPSYFNFSGSLG